MTIVVTHTTPADSSFSTEGAAAWNADHALSGVGTMAEQDANNVAITGGAIDGTTLGATTPNAATFTTLGIDCPTTNAALLPATQINSWVYSGKSFSVTAQETSPIGVFFKPDGTKMYVTGSAGDDVNEYTLSTAWDVSTATYTAVSTGITQDTAPNDLSFKSDGLTLFVLGGTNDTVYQYTLSSAWDITTATYSSKSFSVTTQESLPAGIWMKPDGSEMYVVGTSADAVFQYTLSTPWDVSTASYSNKTYSFAAQEGTANGIAFSNDGSKMYIVGLSGDDIWQYNLATPWDVTTATPFNNFYVGFQEANPAGIYVDSTAANRVYVVGSTADTVFQYNTETSAVALNTDKLFVDGATSVNGNFVAGSNAHVDGAFDVQGASTFSTTNVTGSLTASSTLSLTGATTSTTSLGTGATTGTLLLGGTSQTGTMTVGQSTASQTTNIQAGATASGSTKTINLGTAGLSGSTTNINIGSNVSGSLGTLSLRSPTINLGQTATQFSVTNTASAVNYVQVTGAATGGTPSISAQGSDTNVTMFYQSKGVGAHIFGTRGSVQQFRVLDGGASSTANYATVAGSAVGSPPAFSVAGSDTNIDLALTPKGTGLVCFGTYTANMALTVQGYIEIKDSGGTIRRLAVIG